MQSRYEATVPNNLSISESWQIASILIDNPSGSWLYVSPLNRYIPPHTIAWSANFKPTTQSVSVLFADAPAGGIASVNIGGPVIVQIFDQPTIDNSGNVYDVQTSLVNLQADVNALQAAIVDVDTKITNLKDGWGEQHALVTEFFEFSMDSEEVGIMPTALTAAPSVGNPQITLVSIEVTGYAIATVGANDILFPLRGIHVVSFFSNSGGINPIAVFPLDALTPNGKRVWNGDAGRLNYEIPPPLNLPKRLYASITKTPYPVGGAWNLYNLAVSYFLET
jgi:hypothetical protein